ncbi:hypothetical protein Bca101_021056 [Brassica carinata]
MILAENVGTKNIAEVLSRWTVIPVTSLFQTEKERVNGLTVMFQKRAGGQDQVVNAVSDALLWSRAGLGYSRNVFGSNHAVVHWFQNFQGCDGNSRTNIQCSGSMYGIVGRTGVR